MTVGENKTNAFRRYPYSLERKDKTSQSRVRERTPQFHTNFKYRTDGRTHNENNLDDGPKSAKINHLGGYDKSLTFVYKNIPKNALRQGLTRSPFNNRTHNFPG